VITSAGRGPALRNSSKIRRCCRRSRDVPVAYHARERGHGRTERRTLKVTAVARGLAFPCAARAIQITRRRKVKGEVVA
jgi:hypothetical protein